MIFNFVYAIPAVILLPFVLFRGNEPNKKRENTVFLSVLILMFGLMILRSYNDGSDRFSYFLIFNNIKTISLAELIKGTSFIHPHTYSCVESGYVYLNWIISHIGLSYYGLIVIYSFVCTATVYFLIKNNCDNYLLGLLIYVSIGAYSQAFTMYRQQLAFCILAFSINSIRDKKPVKFIIYVIAASFFHRTALFFLFVYPLSLITPNKYVFSGFVAFCAALVILVPRLYNILLKQLLVILNKDVYPFENFKFREMTLVIFVMLAYVLFLEEKHLSTIDRTDQVVFWATAVSLIMFSIGMYNSQFTRVAMFMYLPFCSILIPNVNGKIENKKVRSILEKLIVLGFFAYCLFVCLFWRHSYIPIWIM